VEGRRWIKGQARGESMGKSEGIAPAATSTTAFPRTPALTAVTGVGEATIDVLSSARMEKSERKGRWRRTKPCRPWAMKLRKEVLVAP